MSLEKFADIYRTNGFTVDIDGNDLLLELDGTAERRCPAEWCKS